MAAKTGVERSILNVNGDPSAGLGTPSPVTTIAEDTTTGALWVKTGGADTAWTKVGSGGTGTVTSVALALPVSVFTVTGSPVTTAGTLTGSFNTQTANTVFAGPATAGPSVPTFRALVAADIPSIPSSKITGDPNTVAFFGPGGTLTDSVLFTFGASASQALAFGVGGPTASGNSSLAFGQVRGGSAITVNSPGSLAFGNTNSSAVVQATGSGSMAMGQATTGTNTIQAAGNGCLAGGTDDVGSVVVTQDSSIGFGTDINATANRSQTFGQSHNNDTLLTAVFGRFSVTPAAGNENTWVTTDPLFVLGNGASSGSRANGFEIDKDGRMVTTAAQVNTAIRAATNPDTLSARTDRTLLVNTSVGVIPYVVNMPAGVNGLEFFVEDTGGNASVNNITFTPNGGDVMQSGSNITTNYGSRQFEFFNGVWHIISGASGVTPPSNIRVATGTDTISATTDSRVVYNAVAGAYNINLPAGTTGLHFSIVQAATNAGTFTIVPNGGDVLDTNIQPIFNASIATPLTWIAGTWYSV